MKLSSRNQNPSCVSYVAFWAWNLTQLAWSFTRVNLPYPLRVPCRCGNRFISLQSIDGDSTVIIWPRCLRYYKKRVSVTGSKGQANYFSSSTSARRAPRIPLILKFSFATMFGKNLRFFCIRSYSKFKAETGVFATTSAVRSIACI